VIELREPADSLRPPHGFNIRPSTDDGPRAPKGREEEGLSGGPDAVLEDRAAPAPEEREGAGRSAGERLGASSSGCSSPIGSSESEMGDRPPADRSRPGSAGMIGGNGDVSGTAGLVGDPAAACNSAAGPFSPGRGRGRGAIGAVTPGMSSKGRLTAGAAAPGLRIGVDESAEPGLESGAASGAAGAAAGASKTGGKSCGG
jgi:hypothetical protein